jgi:probable F420-dependent oxidoreductase
VTVKVGVGWSPLDRGAVGSARFFDTVDLLEELDYDSLWLSDTALGPGAAPLVVLAAVAARTKRLKLGTSVLVVPPRSPVLLAKELATLDVVSGGRFFPALGIGVNQPAELAALGIPREERAARLEEAVTVIEALWRGEPVSFRGRFTVLEDVTLSPKPVRDRLELWLSGTSDVALRRVGRLGSGWLSSFVSADEFETMVGKIRAAAAEAGREVPEDHYGMIVFGAASAEEASAAVTVLQRRRPELPADEVVGIGADGVRRLLGRFRAAGAQKFVLIPVAADPPAFLRELKDEVVDPFEAAG